MPAAPQTLRPLTPRHHQKRCLIYGPADRGLRYRRCGDVCWSPHLLATLCAFSLPYRISKKSGVDEAYSMRHIWRLLFGRQGNQERARIGEEELLLNVPDE